MYLKQNNMTTGDIYEKNRQVYNNEAFVFISENLINKGDMCHKPYGFMLNYTRTLIEKITDEYYLVFEARVDKIKYKEYREVEYYNGDYTNVSIYSKDKLISMFGFEISCNPRSVSNRFLELTSLK